MRISPRNNPTSIQQNNFKLDEIRAYVDPRKPIVQINPGTELEYTHI